MGGVGSGVTLRERQRSQLIAHIRQTAYRLFAERGYDAVTTEDIAAAAGISPSTYFRCVPNKEGLLVDALTEAVAGTVTSFERRPPQESARDALVRAILEQTDLFKDEVETWHRAMAGAPALLARVTLLAPADRERLITLVGTRMDRDPATDLVPGLLVHVMLAAAEHAYRLWLASPGYPSPSLRDLVAESLAITAAAQWD